MAKTIFLVEDDLFLNRMLTKKFEDAGFVMHAVKEGSTAVEEIKKVKPDLVLLDIIVPGSDGFEILTALKDSAETKDIPVIAVSNLKQKEDINEILSLGAQEFIPKAEVAFSEFFKKIKEKVGE